MMRKSTKKAETRPSQSLSTFKYLSNFKRSKNSVGHKKHTTNFILQLTGAPSTIFYSSPKIYEANIPFRIIVSHVALPHRLTIFLTKILQQYCSNKKYCSNNLSFVRDSKGLAESLKEQKLAPDETSIFQCQCTVHQHSSWNEVINKNSWNT